MTDLGLTGAGAGSTGDLPGKDCGALYGVTDGKLELFSKLIPFRKELETVGKLLGLPFGMGAFDEEGFENNCRAAGLLCNLALFKACL